MTHFSNHSELEEKYSTLIKAATKASKKAYAPYSSFHVGAAILTKSGNIILGNNQENASYPVGTCAERVALNYLKSQDPQAEIEAVAIYAETHLKRTETPISPCGMCRQALLEAESNQEIPMKVLLSSANDKIFLLDSISHLLPFGFTKTKLKNSLHG